MISWRNWILKRQNHQPHIWKHYRWHNNGRYGSRLGMCWWQILTKKKLLISLLYIIDTHSNPSWRILRHQKKSKNYNNYVSPLVHHLHHHSLSSMFMSSFTKQDKRPQPFLNQRMSTITILSHRYEMRLLQTYPCMKITWLTMHTRRYVVNYLTANNQDVKAKEGKITVRSRNHKHFLIRLGGWNYLYGQLRWYKIYNCRRNY